MGTQVKKPKPRTAGVSALEKELAAAHARIRELEQQLAEARDGKPKAGDAIFAAVDRVIGVAEADRVIDEADRVIDEAEAERAKGNPPPKGTS